LVDVKTRLTVRRHEWVSDSVVCLELGDPDGRPLPPWSPGSHIDLALPGGIVRQYSLCGVTTDSVWRVGVLREPQSRGGSAYVCDSLRVGDVVEAGTPRNNFPLVQADGYCFVAGGIGITPVLPMMAGAARQDRPIRLHYGGRRRSSMAFLDEVAKYGDEVTVHPEDEVGLLPVLDVVGALPAGWAVYCCGPEPLIRAVESACSSRPDLTLRLERFIPVTADASVDVPETYTVVLERSAMEVAVSKDESILDALEAAGAPVSQECREGICGACETKVLDGDPDHRDSILTAAEKASCSTMFICVSGSRSARLVLDL
jgi:ferredoxin-NADP reductase